MSILPKWAEAIVPVDMEGAAALLGIARRTLVDVIRDHPHYEPRGTRKVFYPEHIAALKLAIETAPPASRQEALRREILNRLPSRSIEAGDIFLKRETVGRVYMIRCHDRIKIGFATDFAVGMRVLRTACPYPVETVAVFPGDRTLELFLHRCFAEQRRHGEWFENEGDLRMVVAAMLEVPE